MQRHLHDAAAVFEADLALQARGGAALHRFPPHRWGYPPAHRRTSNRFPSRAGCRQTIGAAQITIQTWHRQAGQGGSAATFAFSAAMLSAVHPGASVSDAQESA